MSFLVHQYHFAASAQFTWIAYMSALLVTSAYDLLLICLVLNLVEGRHEERPSKVELPGLRVNQEVAVADPRDHTVHQRCESDDRRDGAEYQPDHEVQRGARVACPHAVEVLDLLKYLCISEIWYSTEPHISWSQLSPKQSSQGK